MMELSKGFRLTAVLLTIAVLCNASGDRSDWIDPNDMLHFDHSSGTMSKKQMPKVMPDSKAHAEVSEENLDGGKDSSSSQETATSSVTGTCSPCPPCEPCAELVRECPPCERDAVCDRASLPLLRKFVSHVHDHLGQVPGEGEETLDYTMHITLTAGQATILERFMSEGNQKHVHDVHDVLSRMIIRVASSHLSRMEKLVVWFEDKIGLKLDRLIQFAMLGSLASVVLLIELKLQIPWRRRVSQLIILMFFISIPWTWFELYKQAEIKQQSIASKPPPADCLNPDKDIFTWLKSYVTFQDDKCQEYNELLMIDPLVKVPPTKAIAVTVVRFFLAPLRDIGGAFSEFIRALFKDLPLTMYPIAMVTVGAVMFLLCFMMFGYSFETFFFSIRRNPSLAASDGQLKQAILDANQRLQLQLEEIKKTVESSDKKVSERLQTLEHVNQVAIEYRSSQSSDTEQSPTLSSDFFQRPSSSPVKLKHCSPLKKSPHKTAQASKSEETLSKTVYSGNDATMSPTRARRNLDLHRDDVGPQVEDLDGEEAPMVVRRSPRKPKYPIQESGVPANNDSEITSVKRQI